MTKYERDILLMIVARVLGPFVALGLLFLIAALA
jgi:hypothetical protein